MGGGSHRCGNAVGFWTAWYLMGPCMLSGSGGWHSTWLEPWGKSCLEKKFFHMGQAVWLLRTSREEGVGLVLLLTCIYEEWCMFINYLK